MYPFPLLYFLSNGQFTFGDVTSGQSLKELLI